MRHCCAIQTRWHISVGSASLLSYEAQQSQSKEEILWMKETEMKLYGCCWIIWLLVNPANREWLLSVSLRELELIAGDDSQVCGLQQVCQSVKRRKKKKAGHLEAASSNIQRPLLASRWPRWVSSSGGTSYRSHCGWRFIFPGKKDCLLPVGSLWSLNFDLSPSKESVSKTESSSSCVQLFAESSSPVDVFYSSRRCSARSTVRVLTCRGLTIHGRSPSLPELKLKTVT